MSSPPIVDGLRPDELRRAVLGAPPDAAAQVLAEGVREQLEARAVELRLIDRGQRVLHPVHVAGGGDGAAWWFDEPAAAWEAFAGAFVRREGSGDGTRVHVPVSTRGFARGLLTVSGPDVDVDDASWADLGSLVSLLMADAGRATDRFEVARRTSSFSVSAEFQWQLLPAPSVDVDGLALRALIEPAPRVASDLFDWSVEDDHLWAAVLDAEGRNLSAALPAALAVAALRHGRRSGASPAEQVALADQAVYDHFRGQAVVRALVLGIDLERGEVSAVRAGDVGDDREDGRMPSVAPTVFRRRGGVGGTVEELALPEHEAFGRFDRSPYRDQRLDLAPGDTALVVSDGGPAARDTTGRAFGTGSVAEHLAQARYPASVPRRLLDALRTHAGAELAQDATALVLDWRA